jgi:hypothetical protein
MDGWMAMRFGCCASKEDAEDRRDALGVNGMFRLHFNFSHPYFQIPSLYASVFSSVSSPSFSSAPQRSRSRAVELLFLAYALLNLVNDLQRYCDMPGTRSTGYTRRNQPQR